MQLFHSLTTFFSDSLMCYIGSTPPVKERKKEKEGITTVPVFHGLCFITGSALSIQGNFFNPFHARDLFLYLLKTSCFQGVQKEASGMKWVKYVILGLNPNMDGPRMFCEWIGGSQLFFPSALISFSMMIESFCEQHVVPKSIHANNRSVPAPLTSALF